MSEHHLIFGSGQVGRQLAGCLVAAGHRVTVVSRRAAPLPAGCIALLGDAMDPAFCIEAARGARVIYHTVNPPYSGKIWEKPCPCSPSTCCRQPRRRMPAWWSWTISTVTAP